jgi:hypothetical protein
MTQIFDALRRLAATEGEIRISIQHLDPSNTWVTVRGTLSLNPQGQLMFRHLDSSGRINYRIRAVEFPTPSVRYANLEAPVAVTSVLTMCMQMLQQSLSIGSAAQDSLSELQLLGNGLQVGYAVVSQQDEQMRLERHQLMDERQLQEKWAPHTR